MGSSFIVLEGSGTKGCWHFPGQEESPAVTCCSVSCLLQEGTHGYWGVEGEVSTLNRWSFSSSTSRSSDPRDCGLVATASLRNGGPGPLASLSKSSHESQSCIDAPVVWPSGDNYPFWVRRGAKFDTPRCVSLA